MADIPESTKSEHVAWTVDATSYLRNLDSEDLRAETFAVHHQAAPEQTETGTRISLRFPTLIVSGYCSEPREVADRVARILNAHWDEPAAPPAMDREAVDDVVAALLVSLTESGVRSDTLEMLTGGDDRGTIAPGDLRKAVAHALSAGAGQPGTSIWDSYRLPCDVHLAPATIIRAGCQLSTLKVAMEVPHRPKHFEGHPNAALSTLSADAIRQGEGVESTVRLAVWNAAKKKGISDEAAMATVEAVIAELPATPASHASDGGKA